MRAGEDYLAALRKLGIEPEALFWAIDHARETPVLMLVSRYFDAVGPLAIQTALFKAYNAAVTPKEIDPFIVRLHSPNHRMIRDLESWLSHDGLTLAMEWPDGTKRNWDLYDPNEKETSLVYRNEIETAVRYVYKFALDSRRGVDFIARWRGIERTVEKLAA